MVWKRTISAKALEGAGHASVKVGEEVIFIAAVDGALHAIDAVCSHAKCVLGDFDKSSLQVKCPCHHAVFDLKSGEMLVPPFVAPNAPKEKLGLKTYGIRSNEGFIEVEIKE